MHACCKNILIVMWIAAPAVFSANKAPDRVDDILASMKQFQSIGHDSLAMDQAILNLEKLLDKNMKPLQEKDFLTLQDRTQDLSEAAAIWPVQLGTTTFYPEIWSRLLTDWHQGIHDIQKRMSEDFQDFPYKKHLEYMLPHLQSQQCLNSAKTDLIQAAVFNYSHIERTDEKQTGMNGLKNILDNTILTTKGDDTGARQEVSVLKKLSASLDSLQSLLLSETHPDLKKKTSVLLNRVSNKNKDCRKLLENRLKHQANHKSAIQHAEDQDVQGKLDYDELKTALTARDWVRKGLNAPDSEISIRYFTQAILLDSTYTSAWLNRGITYNARQQYQDAENDFSKAIALKPDIPELYLNRGINFSDMNQPCQAVKDFTKVIETDSAEVIAWLNRGRAYHMLHQFENALADYNKAARIDPDNVQIYNNRAITRKELHHLNQAAEDHLTAIKLDSTNASAWYNLGRIYWEQKKWKQVVNAWEKCLALDPDHELAKKWLPVAMKEAKPWLKEKKTYTIYVEKEIEE